MDDTTRANGYKHGRPEGRDVKPADEIVRKVIEALPAETRLYPDVYAWQVTDALEAATSAPAVDREALRGALANVLSDVTNYPKAVQTKMLGQYTGGLIESAAVAVEQSFRDVRDVQAEGADLAADWLAQQLWPNAADYAGHVRQFAQAIREARNEH